MFHIVWQFRVPARHEAAFLAHYGPSGTWAKLFARGAGYRGTSLLRDVTDSTRFVTIDRWDSAADHDRFKTERAAEYDALDRRCDELTSDEQHIGAFETI